MSGTVPYSTQLPRWAASDVQAYHYAEGRVIRAHGKVTATAGAEFAPEMDEGLIMFADRTVGTVYYVDPHTMTTNAIWREPQDRAPQTYSISFLGLDDPER